MNCEAIAVPRRMLAIPRPLVLPWRKLKPRRKPRVVSDMSGNLKLKNKNNVTGSTSNPTQGSNTYAVIPEMTTTVTTKGNQVFIDFTGTFSMSGTGTGAGNCFFAVFKDGSQLTQDYEVDIPSASELGFNFQMSITYMDSPTAASHTYDIRWKFTGSVSNHIVATGTARTLQLVELG